MAHGRLQHDPAEVNYPRTLKLTVAEGSSPMADFDGLGDRMTEALDEHTATGEPASEYDEDEASQIVYNQTDPTVISDGINSLTVVEESDDRYLIDYWATGWAVLLCTAVLL